MGAAGEQADGPGDVADLVVGGVGDPDPGAGHDEGGDAAEDEGEHHSPATSATAAVSMPGPLTLVPSFLPVLLLVPQRMQMTASAARGPLQEGQNRMGLGAAGGGAAGADVAGAVGIGA